MTTGPAMPPGASTLVTTFPYRYVPLVVAYDVGDRAKNCALSLHREGERRGFDGPWLPITEALGLRLDRFPSLILVTRSEQASLGAQPLDLRSALRPSEDLVMGYRARWPNGLLDLINHRVASYEAGVVQVIGPSTILNDPAAERLLQNVCVRHDIDKLTDLGAIFAVYARNAPGIIVPGSGMVLARPEFLVLWGLVTPWGLTEVAQVGPLLNRIEAMRQDYESRSKPALHRPIHGVPMNRLDFILDDPTREGELATWNPDGARVVRQVIEQLRKIVPTLTNPEPTRGSTKRFSNFYINLKNIHLALSYPPPEDQ